MSVRFTSVWLRTSGCFTLPTIDTNKTTLKATLECQKKVSAPWSRDLRLTLRKTNLKLLVFLGPVETQY